MSPEDLENRLLSSITSSEELAVCMEEGITVDSFVVAEPDHAAVFTYIVEHIRAHDGAVPTGDDLLALHTFTVSDPGDTRAYAIEVRKRELARKARDTILQQVDQIESDPVGTISKLAVELSELSLSTKRNVKFLDGDAGGRFDMFQEAKEASKAGKVLGIPTGLKSFDDNQLGFQRGHFIVIMGATGIGKSWLAMRMAVAAHEAGHKVLMVSPELTTDEQGYRFDVIKAACRKFSLSNEGLFTGREDAGRYEKFTNLISKDHRFVCVDAAEDSRPLSFNDVWQLVLEHKPDEVIVDGLHLLSGSESRRDQQEWSVLKDGVAFLKSLAQRERIVIIATHQPDRSAQRKKSIEPPGLHQVGYGLSVMQSADRVISMAAGTSLGALAEQQRVFTVPKIRFGKPIVVSRTLKWDVDRGIIEEIRRDPGAEIADSETPDDSRF